MMKFNEVLLTGNLTRDPELRYVTAGRAVCSGSLAHNSRYQTEAGEWKDGKPLFIDFTIWGEQAEVFCQKAQKGSGVTVAGTLALDQWEDKQGGKRSKVFINATRFSVDFRAREDSPTTGGELVRAGVVAGGEDEESFYNS